MKRVIKNKQKMKNTMFVVFWVYSLVLFGITNLNPSYAEESGIMLDTVIENVVGDGVSTTDTTNTIDEEIHGTDTTETQLWEENDVQEDNSTEQEHSTEWEEAEEVLEEFIEREVVYWEETE